MTRRCVVAYGILSALPVLIALHMARGVAPLFALLGASALLFHFWPKRSAVAVERMPLYPLAGLCLWALISSLWAFDPAADGLGALRLCVMMLGGTLLVSAANGLGAGEAGSFRRSFALSYFVLLALILFDQAILNHPVTRLSYALRGMEPPDIFDFSHDIKHRAVLLAVLLGPVCLAAYREWGVRAALFALFAAGGVILSHGSETPSLSLIAALLAALLTWRLQVFSRWAGIAALLILFAAPPFLQGHAPTAQDIARSFPQTPKSLLARILIWDYALGRIAERPVLGFGFDAAREIGGREPARHFDFDPFPDGTIYRPLMEPIPLHTHNGVIQLWLELGAPGALLGALSLIALWMGICKIEDSQKRMAGAALFASAMMPMLSSYGLFQAWWVGSVWIALAALQGAARE
jgi:O-antigen ligase